MKYVALLVMLMHVGQVHAGAVDDIRFDPSGLNASSIPMAWMSRNTVLDEVGRGIEKSHSQPHGMGGGQSPPDLIHQHLQWYGKDDMIVGSVRGWVHASGTMQTGQARAVGYSGSGWVDGLRQIDSASASQLAAWQDFLNDPARPDLEGLPGVVRTQTAGLSGGWTEFERNDLGTPTAELLDGVHQWEAFPYAGGPAIGEVRSPRLGVPQLTPVHWDSEGRLEELGELTYAWSDDGMLLSASEAGVVREERVYDAFGRAVLVRRDGKTLECMHAGKNVIRERSRCGERVWWMSSGLDEPVGYTLHWEPACDEGVIGAAAVTEELELFDVSYASYQDYKPDMLGTSGATFGLVQDLHNDVVGVLDAGVVGGVKAREFDE